MPTFPTHLVIPVFLVLDIWLERSGGRKLWTKGMLAATLDQIEFMYLPAASPALKKHRNYSPN